jgi:hypothetical protein
MELYKFHVLYSCACTPGYGDAITSGGIWIASVKIHFAAPSRRENRIERAYCVYFISGFIKHIRAHATILSGKTKPLGHYKINYNSLLADINTGSAHTANHSLFALFASDVSSVKNASGAMPALAREIPTPIIVERKLHAAINQICNSSRSVFTNLVNDRGLAEPSTGDHSVASVAIERIGRIHNATDAALREVRVAVLKPSFRNERHIPERRKMEGCGEPRHS